MNSDCYHLSPMAGTLSTTQAAREVLTEGHCVILLGRDERKNNEAIESFGTARDRARFLSVDLLTHESVRDAARKVNELTGRIDGIVHSAAVFATKMSERRERCMDVLRLRESCLVPQCAGVKYEQLPSWEG